MLFDLLLAAIIITVYIRECAIKTFQLDRYYQMDPFLIYPFMVLQASHFYQLIDFVFVYLYLALFIVKFIVATYLLIDAPGGFN